MNRRNFIRLMMYGTAAIPASTYCYGMYEAGWVEVKKKSLSFPRLPNSFVGMRIAFLTDIHHGPYVDQHFIKQIIRTTNLLSPDLILLGGDYSLRHSNYILPCFDLLKDLRAPMGVYGVLGNHDYVHGINESKLGFKKSKIVELTNQGVWLNRKGERLRLGGVDDLWFGKPDLGPVLDSMKQDESCLLVSHNPDFAEGIISTQVGLCLSGHTHGGQVVLPGQHAPFCPSQFGNKYLRGVCAAPNTTVYVSRGLGTTAAPIRLGARPELTIITLVSNDIGLKL